MNLKLKRRLAATGVVAVVAFGGSAGTALACHGGGTSGVAGASFTAFRGNAGLSDHARWHGWRGWHGDWSAVTSYLGLSADTIKHLLGAGPAILAWHESGC